MCEVMCQLAGLLAISGIRYLFGGAGRHTIENMEIGRISDVEVQMI